MFENTEDRTVHRKSRNKGDNDMIDGQIFFDQSIKKDLRIYDNIRKITIRQGDYCTTDCLLDYIYFKKYYKMIARDLTKQQALDADPKAIQQINFTVNLNQGRNVIGNTTMFFVIEKSKETILDFPQGTVKAFLFCFNTIST